MLACWSVIMVSSRTYFTHSMDWLFTAAVEGAIGLGTYFAMPSM